MKGIYVLAKSKPKGVVVQVKSNLVSWIHDSIIYRVSFRWFSLLTKPGLSRSLSYLKVADVIHINLL